MTVYLSVVAGPSKAQRGQIKCWDMWHPMWLEPQIICIIVVLKVLKLKTDSIATGVLIYHYMIGKNFPVLNCTKFSLIGDYEEK